MSQTPDTHEPYCDTCGMSCEVANEYTPGWCGNCGQCGEHCNDEEGCEDA